MKRLKSVALLLVTVLIATMIFGCSSKNNDKGSETGNGKEQQKRVGMILSGPITDVAWNGPQYDALKEIEKQGASIAYQEGIDASDVGDALYTYCEEGFDVVFLGTNFYEETALPIIEEYPDITFFITNGTTTKGNVHSFQVADEQQGFMMGVIAALASESRKVGFVGGREITPIINGLVGFEQGVAYVDTNVNALTSVTGSSTDVTMAKETARSMVENGVDVLAPIADNASFGVAEAAQESGVYAVASGKGQNEVAPDSVLISVIKNNGIGIVSAYESYLKGTLSSETARFGAAEGVIYLSDWYAPADKLPDEVKNQVKAIYDDLAAGKIDIKTEG